MTIKKCSVCKNTLMIKKRFTSKAYSTIELLGCSFESFKSYFESKFTEGMTWERLINTTDIHIDHIMPICNFDLINPEEQKKCFHYTNLQSLWAIDNMKKHTKILTSVDDII